MPTDIIADDLQARWTGPESDGGSQYILWLLDTQATMMVYQPIRRLATGCVVGYESLTRFRGAPRGPVEDVFARARAVGLGRELERASVAQALGDLDDIPGYLAINLSPSSLVDESVLLLLESVPGERVVIELTEHDPVVDYPELRKTLGWLKARGYRIAADDLCAGYSGLRRIAELQPDILKLDRSMVGGVVHSATHRHLIAAMVAFAEAEGSHLIAEGVETREELVALGELGVELGQGYLLGRPMPLDKRPYEAPSGWRSAADIATVIPLALWRRYSKDHGARFRSTG